MSLAQKRVELWCILIDNIKAMKLVAETKESLRKLIQIEQGLTDLLNAEIIKD